MVLKANRTKDRCTKEAITCGALAALKGLPIRDMKPVITDNTRAECFPSLIRFQKTWMVFTKLGFSKSQRLENLKTKKAAIRSNSSFGIG